MEDIKVAQAHIDFLIDPEIRESIGLDGRTIDQQVLRLCAAYNEALERIGEIGVDRDVAQGDLYLVQQQRDALLKAASKWPRCCDLWQDGLGGMHCKECSQKTFAMFAEVQRILGIDKAGKAIALCSEKGDKIDS